MFFLSFTERLVVLMCSKKTFLTNFAGYKYRLKAFILSLGIIWLMILVEVVSYGR